VEENTYKKRGVRKKSGRFNVASTGFKSHVTIHPSAQSAKKPQARPYDGGGHKRRSLQKKVVSAEEEEQSRGPGEIGRGGEELENDGRRLESMEGRVKRENDLQFLVHGILTLYGKSAGRNETETDALQGPRNGSPS